MKYKLSNKITGEEHICEKAVIDGWDYYVSDEHPSTFKSIDYIICRGALRRGGSFCDFCNKVIATNNPIIDIPKVVNEVEKFENEYFKNTSWGSINPIGHYEALRAGYNKSQETHPNSDDDMIELLDFSKSTNQEKSFYEARCLLNGIHIESKEILRIWKEQRTKTLYYL